MTDIEISQALRIVGLTLEPETLNGVQELVLRECWGGKTYQEIASVSGYDSDYIRVVGSRLWQNLSSALEEKVSKHNFKSVLRQKARENNFSLGTLEFPDGQVPLNSRLYIERPPHESQAYQEILKPGALIVIKSPMNLGKTSLMTRILAYGKAQSYSTVSINFQLAEASVLADLEKFLRWLMANITLQLGLDSALDHYWDQDLGAKVSCTNYLQSHILEQLNRPLVLAFDEVNHLFGYQQIAQEFLPVVRFWHEEANNAEIWNRLRMIMVHSTDIYIPLDMDISPLNLGLPIALPEFSYEEVRELALRHEFQLPCQDLEQDLRALMEMVGGYPYLIRLAFYALSTQQISFQELLQNAPTSSGIYRSLLQRYYAIICRHPELSSSFQRVVEADEPVQIPTIAAFKLSGLGLIRLFGNTVSPSCQLYRLYFRDYL